MWNNFIKFILSTAIEKLFKNVKYFTPKHTTFLIFAQNVKVNKFLFELIDLFYLKFGEENHSVTLDYSV